MKIKLNFTIILYHKKGNVKYFIRLRCYELGIYYEISAAL